MYLKAIITVSVSVDRKILINYLYKRTVQQELFSFPKSKAKVLIVGSSGVKHG